MEVPDTHIEILRLIHDSENHCIKENDIKKLQLTFPQFNEILEGLVSAEFIEYVLGENAYYLAYDGFVMIENANASERTAQVVHESKAEQYENFVNSLGGEKSFKIIIISIIFTLGISGMLLLFSNQSSIVIDNKNNKFNIDNEAVHQIKVQNQKPMDSIQNSNKNKPLLNK